MLLLQSLVPLACMQGIKSKARAIKCWREEKYLPNECCNIPFYTFLLSFFFILERKDVKMLKKMILTCKNSNRKGEGRFYFVVPQVSFGQGTALRASGSCPVHSVTYMCSFGTWHTLEVVDKILVKKSKNILYLRRKNRSLYRVVFWHAKLINYLNRIEKSILQRGSNSHKCLELEILL